MRIIPIEAVFLALSIEIFGFGSALLGYLRRNLVDAAIARRVLAVSAPVAIGFGFLAHRVPAGMIMGLIGGLMIVLSGAMFYAIFHGGIEAHDPGAAGDGPPTRVDLTGRKY